MTDDLPTSPPAPPQYSADGRWWWNGGEWVAAAQISPAQSQAQHGAVVGPKKSSTLLVVAGLTVAIFAVIAVAYSMHQERQAGAEVDRIMCERWDSCD